MSCEPCTKVNNEKARSFMACGWIPQTKWRRKAPWPVPGFRGDVTVCPGYSSKLGAVQDVARAWSWWTKGQLETKYPQPSTLLMDLVEVFNGAQVGAENYEQDERMRRAKERH